MLNWLRQARWLVIRDVLLTFAGLAVIMKEVFFATPPNTEILITGLAMSGIGASFHLGTILTGFIGSGSSPHAPPHGSSPSSTSRESSGE